MSLILLIILVLNLAVITIHIIGQLYTLYSSRSSEGELLQVPTGKVTIHVPVHNEPPKLVIQTLKCLSKIKYENYEVIVLDNNTTDEKLYAPIRKFCSENEKFRFYHFDNVSGFKAGALNLCNELSDAATEYYLIVDADYCVSKNIIHKGLREFNDANIGLVQFPQSYRNNRSADCSLMMDYSYYFDLVLNKANQFNCPLPTGTLTFIRKETLDQLGGWKTNSVTEDAELGLHLYKNRFQIKYVPQVVGKGLAPYDYVTLRKQRQRWIFGNFQILMSYFRGSTSMNLSFMYGIILQLTAWMNFAGISFILLILSSVFHLFTPISDFQNIQSVALAGIAIHLLGKLILYIAYAKNTPQYSYGTALKAWLIHLSLMYDGAFCWWKLFLGKRIPFITTSKLKLSKAFGLSYHAFIIPIALIIHVLVLHMAGLSIISFFSSVLFILYCLAPIFFIKTIRTNNYYP